jgi:hypothetical protein
MLLGAENTNKHTLQLDTYNLYLRIRMKKGENNLFQYLVIFWPVIEKSAYDVQRRKEILTTRAIQKSTLLFRQRKMVLQTEQSK